MSYVLAVDVGTSFTAAAVVRMDQNAPRVPESLPLGLRGTAVPSVVFYPEEGPVLVGEAAERRGLDTPGRVVREFKRRVGDSVPIVVGTLSLPAGEVFATMARWVADRAEEREGAPPSEIVLSHPAAWGGHRTAVVLEALAAKGLHSVTLISEPEAAALHYASQMRVEDGSTIAIYDLGGGTFDTAILRKSDSSHFEFLGLPEGIEGLGGADFDAAVFRHVADHAGAALAGVDPEAPGALAALARLRRECIEAKEALSSDSEASISVLLPGVQQQVRLVRSEFEAMIEEPIRETVDALERSLQDLGLTADDLSAVLLIGGSSRIPLVAQLISEQLDRPIAVDADPKSSICLGAAVAALRTQPAAAASFAAAQAAAAVSAPAAGPAAGMSVAAAELTPHSARLASWSRKSATPPGSLAGAGVGAVAGVSARAGSGAHARGAAHGAQARAKGGAHAPKPTVRLTAVAAAAALFTVLTATAAQGPGLGTFTAMFVPEEAGAAADTGSAPDSGTTPGGAGAGAAAAGAGSGAEIPVAGIEASAQKPSDRLASGAGIEKAASSTSGPSSGTSAQPAADIGTSGGGLATGSESGTVSTDPTQASAGSLADPAGTPSTDPAPVPTADPSAPDPVPVLDPVPTPEPQPTPEPTPEPDPTTDPPAPDPAPTTEPPAPDPVPTDPPAPDPVPTTEPPTPEPDPTTEPPAPDPDPTDTPAPESPPPTDPTLIEVLV
jgi:molecular chaperone DnaK